MERVASVISEYISAFRLPKVEFFDVVEILILAFILYEAMVWVKNTRDIPTKSMTYYDKDGKKYQTTWNGSRCTKVVRS